MPEGEKRPRVTMTPAIADAWLAFLVAARRELLAEGKPAQPPKPAEQSRAA